MIYPSFEETNITIMTSQIFLKGTINIENFFIFSTITEEIRCICFREHIKGKKLSKKSKNKIMKEKFLKNHVSLHLYRNNINIKISCEKLSLIGCRSLSDIEYCGDLITREIKKLTKICKEYDSNFVYILKNYSSFIELSKKCRLVDAKGNKREYSLDKNWTDELDIDNKSKKCLKYITSLFTTTSQLESFFEWSLLNNINPSKKKVKTLDFKISMINRIFNIGYKIILVEFYKIFDNIEGYMLNIFRPEVHHKIYIKVIYDCFYKKKKRMFKCITFTVESSGSVTISGPYLPVTELEYNKFMENIIRYEKRIKIDI